MKNKPEEQIRSLLDRFRKLLAAELLRTGIILSLLLGIFMLGLAITGESLWYFSPETKTIILWCIGGIVGFVVFSSGAWVGFAGSGGSAAYSDFALARKLGKRFPNISDKITNALSLIRSKQDYGYSKQLIDVNLDKVAESAADINPGQAVSNRLRKRLQKSLLIVSLVWIIVWAPFYSTIPDAMGRLFHPSEAYAQPKPFSFTVEPGDIQLLTDEALTINTQVQGEIPEKIYLTTDNGMEENTFLVSADSNGTFNHTFPELENSFRYSVHAPSTWWWNGGKHIFSEEYKVKVLNRPQVQSLSITLIPPAYSDLETREQTVTSTEISGLTGTQAQVAVKTNKPVEQAALIFSETNDSLEFDIEHTELQTSFSLIRKDAFTIRLQDFQGNKNSHPASYSVTPINDKHPTVEIIQPDSDVNLGEALQIPLILGIQDDYGISSAAVQYQVKSDYSIDPDTSLKQTAISIPQPGNRSFESRHLWDLNPIGLSPRDRIRYRAVVWDNDNITGPKSGYSDWRTARFPSLDEMYAQTEQQQNASMDQAQEITDFIRNIQEKVDELTLQMKKREEMNWQQEEEAKEIIQSHEELKKKLEEVDKQLSEMLQQAEKHNLFSDNVMEKYQQLQQLFQDIVTPELEKAMQKLQQAIDKANPEEVEQAMEELQMNEEDLAENMDRAMELFKRVKIEQQTDEIVRRINNLVKEQENITKNVDSSDADKNILSQEQQLAADEYEITEKKMEQLSDLMKDFTIMPNKEMSAAIDQAKQDSILENMRQAQQQFQQNQMQKGKQNSQQSEAGLQSLSKQMQQMQQMQQQQMMAEIMDEFRSVLQNVLSLSQEQENLQNRTKPLQRKSPQLESLADDQQNLQINLQHVAAQLFELSQKTFGVTRDIGKALGQSAQNIQKAVEELSQRRVSQAAENQNSAMAGLNETAQQLLASMQNLQSQGSSTGFQDYLQQMEELANRQQQLNQQSSQMGMDGMPNFARQKALQQMASEQMGIRQSLQNIQQGMQGSENEPLGDLDKIGEDMEDVARDFKEGDFKRETIERQQKILSRLLDAQKSLRTRDFSKERESKVAEDAQRSGPDGLPADLGERRNLLQEDLERALQEGYDRSYEEIIRLYFNQLSQINTGDNQGESEQE